MSAAETPEQGAARAKRGPAPARGAARILFVIAACTLAAVFSLLGFWQLSRLAERRAQNATLSARRFNAPLELREIGADTGAARFRRVRIAGSYDYSREFALTLRSRNGSPGVYIITPIARPGTDTLVLVNRGWIYAPDGMTADLTRWREDSSVNAIGFVETFPPPARFVPRSPGRPHAYRWLDRSVIMTDLGRPVAPYYVVVSPDSDVGYAAPRPDRGRSLRSKEVPPRLEPRSIDEGPHRSYAIQWFSFAAISILGLMFFLRRS